MFKLVFPNLKYKEKAIEFINELLVIPRKKNDGIEAWPEFGGAKHDMDEIFEKIKMM